MKSEKGAILIMVAVALLGLTLFSAFVVDQGILYTARRQAQTTADAAALSGAWARVLDDQTNPPASKTSGIVFEEATKFAALNPIWGVAPPPSSVTLDWTCPAGPSGGTTLCVVADVYRDGTHGSQRLETIFLNLVGISHQDARAHAVAWTTGGNATNCMRPWFAIDRYVDVNHDGEYDAGDTYTSPGYTAADIGTAVTFHNNLSPSGYGQVDTGPGGRAIGDAIRQCVNNQTYVTGQVVPVKPGGTVGPERHGVDDVMSWDLGAHYDPLTQTVQGSCVPNCTCGGLMCPNGNTESPRIFVVPVCSPLEPACAAGGQSNGSITITNFLSFLLMGESGNGNNLDIDAIFIGSGGLSAAGGPPSPFLHTVVLIR